MSQSINALAGRVLVLGIEDYESFPLQNELADMNYCPQAGVLDTNLLLKEVSKHEPALLVLLLDEPHPTLLECLRVITSLHPTPMLMFGFRANARDATQALKAGVSHFVADKPKISLLRPQVQCAITTFSIVQALKAEVDELRLPFDEQQVVDQAKHKIMRILKLDEPSAYAHLRKEAMDSSQPLIRVAQRIVKTVAG